MQLLTLECSDVGMLTLEGGRGWRGWLNEAASCLAQMLLYGCCMEAEWEVIWGDCMELL